MLFSLWFILVRGTDLKFTHPETMARTEDEVGDMEETEDDEVANQEKRVKNDFEILFGTHLTKDDQTSRRKTFQLELLSEFPAEIYAFWELLLCRKGTKFCQNVRGGPTWSLLGSNWHVCTQCIWRQ